VTEADASEEARRVATGHGFTELLAEKVGGTARASAVFGEPVERQGVTVIPVARAKWGFGGGSGGRNGEEGAGGGGGTIVSPVGYVELRDGEARFQRIYSGTQIAAAAVACGLSVAVGFGMARKRQARARGPRPTVRGLMLQTAGMGFRFLRRRA